VKRLTIYCAAVLLLVGCSNDSTFSDLDQFIADARSRPEGVIDPVPVFKPYKAFRYNAASKRAPFDVPVQVQQITSFYQKSDVKPDEQRVKELLEAKNLEALSMVGTLEQKGQRWALIDDGEGSVHRVIAGNYMGRNHGRIVNVELDSIQLIEIVSNGIDSWVERPRTLTLKDL